MERLGQRISDHRAMAVVLGIAVVLRVLAMVAYSPALFFSDSWAYVYAAWQRSTIAILPDRPSGYGLAIKVLGLGQHVLTPLITVQHLAGLATGVLVYALLIRRGVPKLAGAVAAAVVLLDANVIGLEQHVMPEALFTLALLGAVALTAERLTDRWTVPVAGLLLAVSVLLRTAGLF